ncbi:nucleoporin nup211-like isoform X3 [Dioscorea cayenensis subsp. rotundata]|uniref:Nucleoporin nup211-like isoform X3 n=1 Tax=Dioscorea cayennensis subsp. rotundata TaxID=55577 RepID=A0AB40D181_DIOCR|nr:nucleoporin nup211-like isoform X3 [Dioscorea cayenensis subsp. rotundata]XP_039145168.1 nucleoporin nup211-like isoform X3 [Dioscorea cayenensis subsp. rotundata]
MRKKLHYSWRYLGGKEVQSTVIGSIRNLAKAFSHYQDEVLVKREELLQYAQSAISGLKLNPEITRIDAEASELWKSVNKMKGLQESSSNGLDMTSRDTALPTVEALKNALAEIQLCSRLEMLLLKKQSIKNGDSAESHSQKVHKLKILAESLANSSTKAEMRIVDQRRQTEEAHNFRVAKASEVSEIEKELVTEILDLERQRDELEVELKKINTRLTAALTRLQKSREERNQFDEASNQIVLHLKAKEDELSRSVASCKLEGDVVHSWINFLESTWVHQSANTDLKEKQTNDELEKYESYFMKLIKHHLLACKVEVGSCLTHIKTIVDNLKIFSEGSAIKSISSDDISNETNPRQILEEDYLKAETKIVTAFNVVDHMKELFYLEQENPFRKQDPQVKELFNDVDKLRVEFGSIQRPTLEIEISKDKVSVSEGTLQSQKTSNSAKTTYSPMSRGIESSNSAAFVIDLQSEKELERLVPDLFPMSTGSSHEEISGWEFDEPEHEQRYSESAEKNQS